MIHLNHAGTSWPKPSEVLEATANALTAPPSAWPAIFDDARQVTADALGARDPANVWLTTGCTSALAHVFTALDLTPEDIILTSNLEHHALWRWPAQMARRGRARHIALPRAPDGPLDLNEAERALRTGRVKLVAVTWGSNLTGELLPVRELARLAHTYGAMMLVDAAQVAGVLPIDVHDLGADILTLAGHKGPQGPRGVGVLWVHPECILPVSFCDLGSASIACAAGMAAGWRWLAEQPETTLSHTWPLYERLHKGLLELPGVRILGPLTDPRLPIAATVWEGRYHDVLANTLRTQGFEVRAGWHCAREAHGPLGALETGTLRFSLGPTSTRDHVDALLLAWKGL